MYLTSTQAAEVLRMSKSSVIKLCKTGKIKDYGVNKEGRKQHHVKLLLGEVKAYKAIRKVPTNGHEPKSEHSTPMLGITSRLSSVERNVDKILARIDRLIQMWS